MTTRSQQQARSRKVAIALAVVCLAVAVPAGVVLVSVRGKPSPSWFGQYDPEATAAYDFRLKDHEGRDFALHDLKGNIVLLTFGFSRCPNICPTTLGNLAAAYRMLPPPVQEKVRVLFISVDERDSPEVLKQYVPFFNENFVGVSGEPALIQDTARAYGASFRKAPAVGSDPSDYTIDHSTYTYLIDQEGKMRILYRFEQMPESSKIAEDIQRILQSRPASGLFSQTGQR